MPLRVALSSELVERVAAPAELLRDWAHQQEDEREVTFEDRIMVRLPQDECDRLIEAKKASRFEPMPGRPMKGYVSVPASDVLDRQPKGIKENLMAPMVARTMPKEVAALDDLKRVLETSR